MKLFQLFNLMNYLFNENNKNKIIKIMEKLTLTKEDYQREIVENLKFIVENIDAVAMTTALKMPDEQLYDLHFLSSVVFENIRYNLKKED